MVFEVGSVSVGLLKIIPVFVFDNFFKHSIFQFCMLLIIFHSLKSSSHLQSGSSSQTDRQRYLHDPHTVLSLVILLS